MWQIFYLEIFHFVLNIFAFLTFFAIFYLYFDAWVVQKNKREIPKLLGFLLLSFSFLARSLYFESTLVVQSSFFNFLGEDVFSLFRLLGYFFLLLSLLIEPLPKLPKKESFSAFFLLTTSLFTFPFLAALIAFFYWRKATLGLERHLKRIAFGFYFLALSELFSLNSLFENTKNIFVFELVSPFKLFWFLAHFFLLLSVLFFLPWVFYYLFKRISTQLFIIFETVIVTIFLLVTVVFSSFLLKNIEEDKKDQLLSSAKVVSFALEGKKKAIFSEAVVLSNDEVLKEALAKKDKKTLKKLATDYLLAYKKNSVLLVSAEGQVLARGENPEQVGESISEDSLFKKALGGAEAVDLVEKSNLFVPVISLKAASLIKNNEEKLGVILVEENLDNAFIDGLKKSTGFEASIFSGDKLSSTTIRLPDDKNRAVGIILNEKPIVKKVLTKKQAAVSTISFLNTSYLASFLPIVNVEDQPIGILSVAQKETEVLRSAIFAIQKTFLSTVLLLFISVFPVYLIAKYLESQMS